jgi:methylated-DNA-[protein]-cysteine S-methyltransferase
MPARLVDTAAGPLLLIEDAGRLVEIRFATGEERDRDITALLGMAEEQIGEFFAGSRKQFDLPLVPARTPFQQRVREAMLSIPYGRTMSYGEIAHLAGGAPRAVGQACGANMLPIVVPCHRVVAAHGIGGYSGAQGLDTKRFLLALEKAATTG